MLLLAEFGSLLTLGLMVYCLVDIITTDDAQPFGIPKLIWMLLVVMLPLVGSVVWLIVGRRAKLAAQPRGSGYERVPDHDRPGRAAVSSPESDAEFQRQVRERAEEQRRRYRRAQEQPGPTPDEPPADHPGPGGDRPA